MPNSRHYRNNQQVEEPRNWQEIEVNVNWETEKVDGTINLDALEFAGQTAIDIIARLQGALSGGIGYFEGDPYRIEIGDLQNPAFIFDGYLDYTDNPQIKDCNIVEVALKRQQGEDWINEVADSFSFRYLASNDYTGAGSISNSDYFGVPYVINYIPDGPQLLILAVSTFSLTKALIESIQDIADQTADLSTNAIPTTGTSVGLGAGVVTAWPLGKIIAAVIKLAVTVAYTIGLIFAIIELVEQIVEQLVPRKRFHLGMPIRLMAQRCCEYLNLTLKSDLLDALDPNNNKWVLIPQKGNKGGEAPTGVDPSTWQEVGYPTSVDGIDTFGDWIRTFKRIFNADYRISNGVFEFERRDYWQNQSNFVIPDTFTNQDAFRNEYSVNSNEIVANYVIKWQTDTQDQNTLDDQRGRIVQLVTRPKTVTNPELVNIKGVQDVDIPFSMATRKNGLTFLEEGLKLFLEAADFLTGQLGQPQSFASRITSRVGAMHLSSHFLSRPKMVVMSGDTLAQNQRTLLSAEKLWDDYHYIESFVTINGSNNQQFIYSEQTIPFCPENFVSLIDNNFVETEEGEKAEIISLNWVVEADRATITYRVFRVYDNNLEIQKLTG